MIIDTHVHLDDITNSKALVKKRMQSLLNHMKKNKVSHSIILADIPSKGEKTKYLSNEELIKLVEQYPQLHIVGKVPLKFSKNEKYLKKIRKNIDSGKIIGIKLYPGYEPFYPKDKNYKKVYDMCLEFDVPLMFHSGDVMESGSLKYARPIYVDDVANKYPDMKIIICHMGNPWQLDTAAVTFKNKNVYADTSGLFYKKLDKQTKQFLDKKIEEFIHWNMHGEKLVFGSDWPITSIKDSISIIQSLHLSKKVSHKEKELILSGNAKRLFKIK